MFHDFAEGFLIQMGVFLPKLARGGFPHSRASFSCDITSSSAKNSLLLNRTINGSSERRDRQERSESGGELGQQLAAEAPRVVASCRVERTLKDTPGVSQRALRRRTLFEDNSDPHVYTPPR